jgi:hypothetical protein
MGKEKEGLQEINLNASILVRLDEKGRKILKDYYKTENDNLFKSETKEGFWEFQIWQFADIFGGTSCGAYAPYSCVAYLIPLSPK